jgi:hypothetical protein
MINSDWVESGRVGDLLHQEILNNELKVSNGLHKRSSYRENEFSYDNKPFDAT